MRVLLLSPIAGRDPLSGDTSYTDALLADPPVGVGYVRYDQALADGSLRIRGRKGASGDAGWLALRGAELALRRAGVMFREPTWLSNNRTGPLGFPPRCAKKARKGQTCRQRRSQQPQPEQNNGLHNGDLLVKDQEVQIEKRFGATKKSALGRLAKH